MDYMRRCENGKMGKCARAQHTLEQNMGNFRKKELQFLDPLFLV